LSDRRQELVAQRRPTVNRLRRHLRDLVPGGAPVHLNAKQAASVSASVRPGDAVGRERKLIAGELLRDNFGQP